MAENEKIQVELTVLDNMSNEIKAISANMQQQFQRQNEELKKSKTAWGDVKTAVFGAVSAYAGMAIVGKVTNFFKDARLEYQENIKMQNQLRVALGYVSQSLNEQADALGKKLIIDNDEITAIQIKLATYIKNEDAVKQLTPAVLDLAAATGMDMVSAAQMVARGVADDGAELGRFKIAVTGASSSVERAISVFQGITDKMGGQAVAAASAKDGFDRLGVTIKDIKERTGGSEVFRMWSDGFNTLVKMWGDGVMQMLGESKKFHEENKKIIVQAKTDTENLLGNAQEFILKQSHEGRLILIEQQRKTEIEKAVGIEEKGAQRLDAINKKYNILKYNEIKQNNDKVVSAAKDAADKQIAYNQAIDQNMIELTNKWREAESEKDTIRTNIMLDNLSDDLDREDAAWLADSGILESRKKLTEEQRKLSYESARDTLGSIAMAAQGHKEFIAVYKTFAIAQALMDTYAGAQAAYKSMASIPVVGPGLGFAAATAAVISGLVRVNEIKNTKFETGTAYASGGMSLVGENGPEYINLPRGARVYNNTQSRTINNTTGLTVNIMDTSGNVIETVRAQLRSGAGDALVRDLVDKMARSM